jgi:hypothetical protein
MKKITLISLASMPIAIFAQAPAPSSSFDEGGGRFLIIILVLVIIFFICRELICWYYKINKMVSNQEEIIRLLKKIAEEDKIASDNKETIIDPFHK